MKRRKGKRGRGRGNKMEEEKENGGYHLLRIQNKAGNIDRFNKSGAVTDQGTSMPRPPGDI